MKDTLYVGVIGQTTGWVAVGIGSGGMDGATIYIGFLSGARRNSKYKEAPVTHMATRRAIHP